MPTSSPVPVVVTCVAGLVALLANLFVLSWVVGDTFLDLRTAALDHPDTFGAIGSRYLIYGGFALLALALAGVAHAWFPRHGVGPALGLALLAGAGLSAIAVVQIFHHAPAHAGVAAWSGTAGLAAIGVANLLAEPPLPARVPPR